MNQVERREAIKELLFSDRNAQIQNLADRFGVSVRTIKYDIEALTCSYPIETVRGRYGGGVKLADWYHPSKRTLSPEQMALLKKLAPSLEGNDLVIMNSMYYAENSHPAIIPVEMFEEAQRIMELNRLANKNTHDTPSSHVFTGKIICDKCGKKYKRVTKKGKHSWNCSTFQTYGKASCHTKQIPEDILMETAAAVMGLERFDEDAFLESIQEVHVPAFNHLVFCLKDGTKDERVWQDRSRRESWTQEMKQQAAAHAKRRYASE